MAEKKKFNSVDLVGIGNLLEHLITADMAEGERILNFLQGNK